MLRDVGLVAHRNEKRGGELALGTVCDGLHAVLGQHRLGHHLVLPNANRNGVAALPWHVGVGPPEASQTPAELTVDGIQPLWKI